MEGHGTPYIYRSNKSDSESTFAELSMEYHNFPVAQQGAEIFEFKVDPVPKLTFLNVMSGALQCSLLRRLNKSEEDRVLS